MLNKSKIVDVETASLKGGICELASVEIGMDGKLKPNSLKVDRVNPECRISFEAVAIHGISQKDVESCPPIADVYKKHQLKGDGYIIAHNAAFDLKMLPQDFVLPNQRVLCTLELARALYPKGVVESHKLGVLFYQFGLNEKFSFEGDFHSAGYDVQVTSAVLEYMLKDKGLDLDTAYALLNQPVELTHCFMKKYRDQGKTWEWVVKNDDSYVRWLLANFNWGDDNQELVQYLKDNVV